MYEGVQRERTIPVDGAYSARGKGPECLAVESGKIERIYVVGAADRLSSLVDICNEGSRYVANFFRLFFYKNYKLIFSHRRLHELSLLICCAVFKAGWSQLG